MKIIHPLHIFNCIVILTLLNGCAERNDPVGSSGNALVLVSQTPVQGAAKDVSVINELAFVADETFGISVYDVSNPADPQFVELYPLQGDELRARTVSVDPTGRIVAVGSGNGLQFFDTLNKHYLNSRGSSNHIQAELHFENDTLHVFRLDQSITDGFNYETFLNIGTEDSLSFGVFTPSYFSRYVTSYELYRFRLDQSNIAYITRNLLGFAVVDYTVNGSAVVIGEMNLPGKIRDAAIFGDVLCLAAGYEGIITVDVTDPDNMEVLGSLSIKYATDIEWIEVVDDKAVLLDDNDGVFLVDISDPTNPELLGELETSDPNNFAVSGGYVYVADEDQGLVIGQIVD